MAIARGSTNGEIADELSMSVATVKAHITHILTKLALSNRTQIALLAHEGGLALLAELIRGRLRARVLDRGVWPREAKSSVRRIVGAPGAMLPATGIMTLWKRS